MLSYKLQIDYNLIGVETPQRTISLCLHVQSNHRERLNDNKVGKNALNVPLNTFILALCCIPYIDFLPMIFL